jgi:hypothetical protein
MTARSAPDVWIGSGSNHELVFIRSGQEVFRVNSANNIVIKDGKNIVLGTNGGSGLMIGTAGGSGGQKLGFFGKTPTIQRGPLPTATTQVASLQAAVNAIRQALIDLGLAT